MTVGDLKKKLNAVNDNVEVFVDDSYFGYNPAKIAELKENFNVVRILTSPEDTTHQDIGFCIT